jgi:hypothetical protein
MTCDNSHSLLYFTVWIQKNGSQFWSRCQFIERSKKSRRWKIVRSAASCAKYSKNGRKIGLPKRQKSIKMVLLLSRQIKVEAGVHFDPVGPFPSGLPQTGEFVSFIPRRSPLASLEEIQYLFVSNTPRINTARAFLSRALDSADDKARSLFLHESDMVGLTKGWAHPSERGWPTCGQNGLTSYEVLW